MSYILDALRKAERERKRTAIADMLASQEPYPTQKKGRTARFYLIVLASLIIPLIAGLWFGVWYAKKTSGHLTGVHQPTGKQAMNLPQNIGQDTAEVKDESPPAPDKDRAVTEKLLQGIPQPKENRKNHGRPVTGQAVTPHNPEETSHSIAPSASEAVKDIPPPDRNRLYSLEELPPALRQKLPDFAFSVFLYTDEPDSRKVRVNGVMMKEGQYVADGLKLEEIIPEGVIFSYRNYRFRVRTP
jgi:general secretion pathway protein B